MNLDAIAEKLYLEMTDPLEVRPRLPAIYAALAQARDGALNDAIAYIREQRRTVCGDSFDILPPIIEGLEKMKGTT